MQLEHELVPHKLLQASSEEIGQHKVRLEQGLAQHKVQVLQELVKHKVLQANSEEFWQQDPAWQLARQSRRAGSGWQLTVPKIVQEIVKANSGEIGQHKVLQTYSEEIGQHKVLLGRELVQHKRLQAMS